MKILKRKSLALGWAFSLWLGSLPGIWAEVVSISGNIDFNVDDAGSYEARLNATGLAIGGGNLNPSANLHVGGNAIVTGTLTVGTTASSSSNLTIFGTVSRSFETWTANGNISGNGVVLAGNTSNDFTLNLPSASAVGDGRIYQIKKIVSSNKVIIGSNSGNIDSSSNVVLTSGNLGSLEVVSSSGNWWIVSLTGQ